VTSPTPHTIQEFAERVERLCDYLLNRMDRDGGKDHDIIHKLKDDAADLQTAIKDGKSMSMSGLYEHMKGLP
jgi:hypothetical protein